MSKLFKPELVMGGEPVHAEHWVLVGHGMAAMRLIEHWAELRPPAVQLTVISGEPVGGYNRIGLSDVLAGKRDMASLQTKTADWYIQAQVNWRHGWVVDIDRHQHTVTLADGQCVPYDRLILATGSDAVLPDVPGVEGAGVQVFRTLDDADNLMQLGAQDTAVVLGGGLLGIEAAVGLAGRGVAVSLLHRGPWLMNRQLDETAADWLMDALTERGVQVHLNTSARAIERQADRVTAVTTETRQRLSATIVIAAMGVQPNVELAQRAGLRVKQGIVVDDQLQTSDPAIWALGECVRHRGQSYGLVGPLYEQARVLADVLCNSAQQAAYCGSTVATHLKVSGVPVFSCGDITDPDAESIFWQDHRQRHYKRLWLRNGRIVGAVLYGDIADGAFFQQLMQQEINVDAWRNHLIFGAAHCPVEELAQAAA